LIEAFYPKPRTNGEVEVAPDGDWTYREDCGESPGALRITQRIVEGGYTYTKGYASGVVPRSADIGLRILKQAFRDAEADTAAVRTLLSYREQ
jgi:hypothetical protein